MSHIHEQFQAPFPPCRCCIAVLCKHTLQPVEVVEAFFIGLFSKIVTAFPFLVYTSNGICMSKVIVSLTCNDFRSTTESIQSEIIHNLLRLSHLIYISIFLN